MVQCGVDDVSESLLKTRHHRIMTSHHKVSISGDVQRDDVVLPLSVEAQFIRSIIDRVSLLNYFLHCQLTAWVHN